MKNYWPAWIITFISTAITAMAAQSLFPVPCIIQLEFAPDEHTMSAYLESIASTKHLSYKVLFYNTVLDYIFIIAYTLLTYYSLKILTGIFGVTTSSWIYFISSFTGFFDILENIFLIRSALYEHAEFSIWYYHIVRIKWALAIVPIIIIPITLVYGCIELLTRDTLGSKKVNA